MAIKLTLTTLIMASLTLMINCQSQYLTLRTNTNRVPTDPGQSLNMECEPTNASLDDSGSHDYYFESIYKIQISKVDVLGQREVIAVLNLLGDRYVVSKKKDTIVDSITFKGNNSHIDLGANNQTILKVYWSKSTIDNVGTYVCEAVGLNEIGEFVSIKSNLIIIRENEDNVIKEATLGLKQKIDSLNNIFKKHLKELKEQMHSQYNEMKYEIYNIKTTLESNYVNETDLNEQYLELKTFVDNQIQSDNVIDQQKYDDISNQVSVAHNTVMVNFSSIKSELLHLKSVIENKSLIQTDKVTKFHLEKTSRDGPTSTTRRTMAATITPESEEWPAEAYSLLRAQSSCPASSFKDAGASYKRIKYISVRLVIGSRQESNGYCQHDDLPTASKSWPRGTYCIIKTKNNDCPVGFEDGLLQAHLNAKNRKDKQITLDAFCCRSDGLHSTPIELPKQKPFYLYR